MAVWIVLGGAQRLNVSEDAQDVLRDRLARWANGSWLIERFDLANVNGYEPSPDERTALINATNDAARSSVPDAIKDEVRKLREFLIQRQAYADSQAPEEPS